MTPDTSKSAIARLRDERLTATGPALDAWSLRASLALGALVAERDAARQAEVDADAAFGSVADDLERVTADRDRLAARVAELEEELRVASEDLIPRRERRR